MSPELFHVGAPKGAVLYNDLDGIVQVSVSPMVSDRVDHRGHPVLSAHVRVADTTETGDVYAVFLSQDKLQADTLKTGFDQDGLTRHGATAHPLGRVAALAQVLDARAMGAITSDGTSLVRSEGVGAATTEVVLTTPNDGSSVALLGGAVLLREAGYPRIS